MKYSNASSNSSSFEAAPFSGDVHQAAAEDLTDVAVSVANLRVLRNGSCANLMRLGGSIMIFDLYFSGTVALEGGVGKAG